MRKTSVFLGNSDNTTTTTNSTTTQPTRRARFKPKVGIVVSAQRSPGKATNQTKSTVDVPITSPVNSKNAGSNQNVVDTNTSSSKDNDVVSNQPSLGTNRITVTATVHSQPGRRSSGSGNSTSPSKRNNSSGNTSSGVLSVNTDGDKQPTIVTNPITPTPTVQSQSSDGQQSTSTNTSISPSRSVGRDSLENTSAGTLSVDRDTNSTGMESTSKNTVTESVGTSQSVGDQLLSTITKTVGNQPMGGDKQLSQNKKKANNTTTTQPARRARIRPKIGLVPNKTPARRTSTRIPVEKTVSETTVISPSSKETSVSQTSTSVAEETLNMNTLPSVESTGDQTSTCAIITTETSTEATADSQERTAAQNTQPSKQTAPTRRSRISPKVTGGKTSKASVQNKVPSPASVASEKEVGKNQDSPSTDNVQLSMVTECENVDATGARDSNIESNKDKVSANVNIASSDKTSSLQDKTSCNNRQVNDSNVTETTSRTSQNIDQPLTSKSAVTENINISSSEKNQDTANSAACSAPSKLTRRARFKPRVGIVGRPNIQLQRNQSKNNAVNKPQTFSSNVARHSGNSEQNSEVRQEIINTEQSSGSLSSSDIATEVTSRQELSGVLSQNIQVQFNQTGGTEQDNQEELRNERSQTALEESIGSNIEQTENYPSSIHLPFPTQENERSAGNTVSSSSPSCVPVMIEDSSILPQSNIRCNDELPSGLELEDSGEVSAQMTEEVNMDNDFSYLCHLQSADDLLQTLLSAQNFASDHGSQRKNGAPVDTCRIPVDTNRISIDTTTSSVHTDPNQSISTPPASETFPKESRIETTSSEKQDHTSDNRLTTNNQGQHTSRIVTKRQRGRPRSKQWAVTSERSFLDISTIPIASNIEIEPEISTSDDIVDHPVLELPVDLIQEDSTRSSSKASTTSRGLKRRFQQRQAGTVKLVLSRKRGESCDVNDSGTKGDASGAKGDTSGTNGDTSSHSVERSANRDNSAISTTPSAASDKEIPERPGHEPNIQIRRKTSKPNNQRRSVVGSRICPEKNLAIDSQSIRNNGATPDGPLATSSRNQKEQELLNDSTTTQGYTDVVCGNASVVPAVSHGEGQEKEISNECFAQEVETGCVAEKENVECGHEKTKTALGGNVRTTDANLSVDGEENIVIDSRQPDPFSESNECFTRTDNRRTESLGSHEDASLGVGEKTSEVSQGDHEPTRNVPEPDNVGSLINNNEGKTSDANSNSSTGLRSSTRFSGSKNKDISAVYNENEGVILDPKSSTPFYDDSLDLPENAFGLISDVERNTGSRSNTEDNVIDSGHAISSSHIQDISLNIPESAIEAVIRNTSGPLPDIVECPECPELALCLTTDDHASIRNKQQSSSQTQPGTLEDNVARTTRRASEEFDEEKGQNVNGTGLNVNNDDLSLETRGQTCTSSDNVVTNTISNETDFETVENERRTSNEKEKEIETTNEKESGQQTSRKTRSRQKPKPSIQRTRKTRGKVVDNDGSEGTNGDNGASGIQQDAGDEGVSGDHDPLVGTSTEDGLSSSIQTAVRENSTTQGIDGLEGLHEGSTPQEPTVQDATKPGGRKRQSKAAKPKIPAKRTRRKGVVDQENETVDASEEARQNNDENHVSIQKSTGTIYQIEIHFSDGNY